MRLKKLNVKILSIICAAAVAMSIGGCGSNSASESTSVVKAESTTTVSDEANSEPAQRDLFAMDTYMTVQAYGENGEEAVDQAAAEIERLDALLSTGSDSSEIGELNTNGGGILSEDTDYLVGRALELNQETEGAFDIAIYPVMEAWGFTTQDYQIPSDDTLQAILPLTDCSKITYDGESQTITFAEEGMKIDLGGIAKGYTSSRIMDIYRECGVTSGLANLGGNVQALGVKPDGSNWRVAIQSPYSTQDYLGVLEVRDKAVITSGGYERYFEQDGERYHHIIDPTTGYPAENGLISVTIISEDGTLADALSTSLFIMGKDKAIEFWKSHSDEFDTILMMEDDTLYVTGGIADSFTTEMKKEIIEK